jgi:hypothetical protein
VIRVLGSRKHILNLGFIYVGKILRTFQYVIAAAIATGWTSGVRFSAGARMVSLLHRVQADSRAHPDSYSMDIGGLFSQR